MLGKKGIAGGLVALSLSVAVAAGAEEVKKIQDNSFLIEEAYNQEDGVVQHIQAFQLMKGGTWQYTFTEEIPVPRQAHQFSFTLPVLHVKETSSTIGLGDLALNYRYQAVLNDTYALSPRFSLLLPTGDEKRGLGSGTVGYQTNIPLSVDIGKYWVTHYNAGVTYIPGSKDAGGAKADQVGYNLGASAIWQPSQKFNVMLEAAWNSNLVSPESGPAEREHSFFLNPGVRFAFDFSSGLQIVPGIAVPVGIGPSSGEYGIFCYLSFEHPLF